MASAINIDAYSDTLVVLGTAAIVVPVLKRVGVSPVLGYLGAGAVLGPLGLGTFVKDVPALFWVTISDAKSVAGIAELGIVFLLFLIGLELSYSRLMNLRRLVFGLGGLQVALSTAAIGAILVQFGHATPVAVILGACLALSSTAIVMELLAEQGRLNSGTGRASFAILLAQDLAVIPVLLFISILGTNSGGNIFVTVGVALLQATVAIAALVVVGRLVLRPLYRQVAATRSSEIFIALSLFVVVCAAVVAAQAGLSMALGSFVAGLLLAETEYRKAIEAAIEPVKGLLLGMFFFTVGMGLDVRELVRDPMLLAACVVGLIALKAALLIVLIRVFRLGWPAAIEAGALLGPGGEFAFVGIGMAASLAVLPKSTASFALAVTSLSMVLIPALSTLGRRLGARAAPAKSANVHLVARPSASAKRTIVVGYGRVGRVVGTMLERHGLAYIATDDDAITVSRERSAGKPVYYGRAQDAAFLKLCGVADASSVVITIHDRAAIDAIVVEVRKLRPDILIVSRARDAEHARHLYLVGASTAVPETIEASLQLSEAALLGLGVAAGPVIASIHEERDVFRKALQAVRGEVAKRAIS